MSAQDAGNLARDHKAAIHNPRASGEAKEHSRQVLDEIERGDVNMQETQPRAGQRGGFTDEGKEQGRVLGGYKVTLNSWCLPFILACFSLTLCSQCYDPRVSGEAKEHAKEVLDDNDAL